jgi:hypothetical protein
MCQLSVWRLILLQPIVYKGKIITQAVRCRLPGDLPCAISFQIGNLNFTVEMKSVRPHNG